MGNCPTPLRQAIRVRDADEVERILRGAGSPEKAAQLINADHSPDCIMDSCSSVQGNALYYTIKYRHDPAVIQKLLVYGGDFHATGVYEETCLHAAARFNCTDTCKSLLKRGADLYATDDSGRYVIHSAAHSMYNTRDTITFLLQEAGKAEDVNLRDFNKRTPLHEAVYFGNMAVIQCLIEFGADVNALSNAKNTPLHMTTKDSPAWQKLVEHGADVNIRNSDDQLPGQLMA